MLFLSCACVSMPGVLFSVGVCACGLFLLIFLHIRVAQAQDYEYAYSTWFTLYMT